jgi:hypothetical protein
LANTSGKKEAKTKNRHQQTTTFFNGLFLTTLFRLFRLPHFFLLKFEIVFVALQNIGEIQHSGDIDGWL